MTLIPIRPAIQCQSIANIHRVFRIRSAERIVGNRRSINQHSAVVLLCIHPSAEHKRLAIIVIGLAYTVGIPENVKSQIIRISAAIRAHSLRIMTLKP